MNAVNPIPEHLAPLSFYHLTLALLQPCTSLLADVCHLAILEVRHALPTMVKAVTYQSLNFIRMHGQATFISDILQSNSLVSLTLNKEFGVNFEQLERLNSDFAPFRQVLFEGKDNNFAWLIGLMTERTGLNIKQTIALFDKIVLLTIKLLADVRLLSTTPSNQHLLKHPLSEKQFFHWFDLQPMLMASLDDKALLEVLGYHPQHTLGYYINQQTNFYKNPPEFETIAKVMLHYSTTRPLAIIPHDVLAKPKRHTPFFAQTDSTQPTPTIFTPTTAVVKATEQKIGWQHTLQRHWMLTATALTALVFGAIALLSPAKEKPKAVANNTQIAKEMPHDVAIIRVDSAPTMVEKSAQPVTSNESTTTTVTSAVVKTQTTTQTKHKKNGNLLQQTPTKASNLAKNTEKSTNKKSPQDELKPRPNSNNVNTKATTKETAKSSKSSVNPKTSTPTKTMDKSAKTASSKQQK